MNAKQALRWALYYRALSTLAALVGLGLVGVGFVLGLGDAVSAAAGGGNPLTELSLRSIALPAAFGALGFAVWQFGKTFAFYKTVTGAVDEQLAERFDSEQVKSEILSVLDDRLAELHDDVRRTKRGVSRLGDDGAGSAGYDQSVGDDAGER